MQLSGLLAPDAAFDVRELPLGSMEPTHVLVPPYQFTHGHDAIELAEIAGYDLYRFQKQGLIDKLGFNLVEQRDGRRVERWAAQETEDVISRRNGKSVEIEVLILTGLFLLGEMKIMYTAHRDDTAKSVFNNIVAALKRTPALWNEVIESGPRYANGQRSITLKSGATVFFRTRTTDSGRGEGFDRLILDEDQNLTEAHMAALLPLVSGVPNGQINYAGSAGGLHSTVQAKLRRSFDAKERGLYYRGWHSDPDTDLDDLDEIARVNPRLGRGLTYEFVAKEFVRMTRPQFGRERGGVATHPREEGADWVIPAEAWAQATDLTSTMANHLRLVLEADPQLDMGTIGVAGLRDDGAVHVEVIAHAPGVAWMVAESKRLAQEHDAQVWLDPKGPCGFMQGDLADAGVAVSLFEPRDLTDAWSWMRTAANPPPDPDTDDPSPTGVKHRGGMLLTQALAAAEVRKLMDRETLRRSTATGVNQGPIVSVMLAGWAVIKATRTVLVDTGFAPRRGTPDGPRTPGRVPRTRQPVRPDFNPRDVRF